MSIDIMDNVRLLHRHYNFTLAHLGPKSFVRLGWRLCAWHRRVGPRHELAVRMHTGSSSLSPRGTASVHPSALTVFLAFLLKL